MAEVFLISRRALGFGAGCLLFLGVVGGTPGAAGLPEDRETAPAITLVPPALVATLTYDFEPWLERFQKRIDRLEGRPKTLANRLELMRLHFYRAGLLAELSHVLSFTSKFRVDTVQEPFDRHSKRAKALAREVLETPGITTQQRAEGYFYLGLSEGYVGLLEYGAGNYLSALVNGLNADNHLEEALRLDPARYDAYVGLGVYQYGTTRLGGLANLIMQGGEDLRLQGLRHIERALRHPIVSRPLALKTLIWFYISEEINPDNADLPAGHPLSRPVCRRRALELMAQYEKDYFGSSAPPGFIGNKGLAMMKAIQFVLDRNYEAARSQFQRVLEIAQYLEREKGYPINPQLTGTVREGIKFCDLMVLSIASGGGVPPGSVCSRIRHQIRFIEDGGSLVEYEAEKIRGEIQNVFYNRLQEMARRGRC